MQLVPKPAHRPHVCALTLRGDDPEGFFTTNTEIRELDPVAYVSVAAVRMMADRLGYLHPDEAEGIAQALEQREHRVQQLEQEVQELNRDFEAIDLLESRGYSARKKAGRPKTRQEA